MPQMNTMSIVQDEITKFISSITMYKYVMFIVTHIYIRMSQHKKHAVLYIVMD
jgi:hypothetical protein